MNTVEEKIGGDPFDVQVFEPIQKMLYVGGSKTSFHCDCTCNVFTQISRDRYRCNSCRTIYVSMLPNAPVLVTHVEQDELPESVLGNTGPAQEIWRPVKAR